ncbi:MAG TPA: hypothetical protein VJY35_14175 [Candidatus Eisenbacteria bacterium]|nr:hypothetical protein [Candidatus Eisenbacteria bacterium]
MHHSITRALVAALVGLALSAPFAVHAQSGLTVSLTAHRVAVDARGRESFAQANQAKPGEVVEYRAAYRNTNGAAVREVQATLPIPDGMEYVARTASPKPALASLDGRTFEPLPLKRKVRLPNGRQALREVPPGEYRFLRWSLGSIAAGQAETVRARVRVVPLVAAATSAR